MRPRAEVQRAEARWESPRSLQRILTAGPLRRLPSPGLPKRGSQGTPDPSRRRNIEAVAPGDP